MDKLKKQIFIALTMLLVASAVTLLLLLNGAKTTVLEEEQSHQANQPAVQQTAQQPEEKTSSAPAQPSDTDEPSSLFDSNTRNHLLSIIQNAPSPAIARTTGIAHITNKHNVQVLREIREYHYLVDQLWLKYHPQAQQTDQLEQVSQADPAKNLSEGEQPLSRQDNWQDVPCDPTRLPDQNANDLSCKESDLGFCAFFENGRPYFCQTKDAKTEYLLNKWASSITVTHRGPVEKTFYYADGKLARYTEKNDNKRLITQLWLSTPLRVTKTDLNGKVLDKYYFTPNKPYVYYPGGNDMGEQNGPWEEKDGQIWMDGQPLLTLPDNSPAPDVCALFPGACKTQAR